MVGSFDSEEGGAVGELLHEQQRGEADHGTAAVGHLRARLEHEKVLGRLFQARLVVAAQDGGERGGEDEEHGDGDEKGAAGWEGGGLLDAVREGEGAGVDDLAEERLVVGELRVEGQHPTNHRGAAVDGLDRSRLLERHQGVGEPGEVIAVRSGLRDGAVSGVDAGGFEGGGGDGGGVLLRPRGVRRLELVGHGGLLFLTVRLGFDAHGGTAGMASVARAHCEPRDRDSGELGGGDGEHDGRL
mmetsp:Transcript_20121/g.50148  ORF Transcript_20121/g.50148 Transcript_20121/m.50148 type:complete len:243 (+) Transcript_20121:204-932(+)